jgi:hypothetical protein
MRTFCQRISAPRHEGSEARKEDKPLAPLSEEQPTQPGPKTPGPKSPPIGAETTPRKASAEVPDTNTPKSEPSKKKGKGEQIAERHPKRQKRAKGPPGNPPQQRQESTLSLSSSQLSVPLAWETSKFTASNGKIVLFVSLTRLADSTSYITHPRLSRCPFCTTRQTSADER